MTGRAEDFEVRNGPDLYVYLSPAADGYTDGAIELGRLKADRGNQNYEVPASAPVGDVRTLPVAVLGPRAGRLDAAAIGRVDAALTFVFDLKGNAPSPVELLRTPGPRLTPGASSVHALLEERRSGR